MKKKLLLILFSTLLAKTMFSQGYPVIDVEAISVGIERLYTAYDEVNGILTQVQQGYEQLQKAVEAAKNWEMDWSNWNGAFDASSPQAMWNSLDLRSELNGTLSQIDSLQRRIVNIEKIFDEKEIEFLNGTGVTVAELMGFKHDEVIRGIENPGTFNRKENMRKAWGKVFQAMDDDKKVYKKLKEPTQYMTEVERALWYRKYPNYTPEEYLISKSRASVLTEGLKHYVAQATDEGKSAESEHNLLTSSNLVNEIIGKKDQTVPEILQKIGMLLGETNKILNVIHMSVLDTNRVVAQSYLDTIRDNGKMLMVDKTSGVADIIDIAKMRTKYDIQNDYDVPMGF